MEKNIKKKTFSISDSELEKFTDKVLNEWGWYRFHYRIWQRQVRDIRENYNGFGMELPYIRVDLDTLFESFIDVEMKKTKNKKYRGFLMWLLELEVPNGKWKTKTTFEK